VKPPPWHLRINPIWFFVGGALEGLLVWWLKQHYPTLGWLVVAATGSIFLVFFGKAILLLWQTRGMTGKRMQEFERLAQEHDALLARFKSGEITQEAYEWRARPILIRLTVVAGKMTGTGV
jgi:uncharacterized membrane protein